MPNPYDTPEGRKALLRADADRFPCGAFSITDADAAIREGLQRDCGAYVIHYFAGRLEDQFTDLEPPPPSWHFKGVARTGEEISIIGENESDMWIKARLAVPVKE